METISPNIFVRDMNETINFYKLLGFEVAMTVPEHSDLIWAMMTCSKVSFMFQSFASLGEDIPEISRQNGGS